MKDEFYGFEKLSLVDFEGKICATLFTSGCNFRCPFCHNSSLVSSTDLQSFDFDEILNYLKKRKGILEAVCISGGEPTLLPSLKNKIKQIKDLGYLIKLDTNGTNYSLLKELIDEKLIDYVAMDIKNGPSNYLKTIGMKAFNLDNVYKSIKLLKSNVVEYEFRTTLIKQYHSLNDINELAILIDGAKRFFFQHFVDRGTCFEENLTEIDEKTAQEYLKVIKEHVEHAYLRGY